MGGRLAAALCAPSLPSLFTTAVILDLSAFSSAQASMAVPTGKAKCG